jgi:hypothetical protein
MRENAGRREDMRIDDVFAVIASSTRWRASVASSIAVSFVAWTSRA